jgi:hypothetical protein
MPASQQLLQQHQSALLAAAVAAQAGSNQRQQQQQSKASRARRGRNDDPDASMSSAPTSDSAMDDDADDDADDDDEAARRSSGDDAVAVPAGPMSRRALLGLPPVGLGHRHKRLLAGQSGMQGQIVKPKPPKNHVSAGGCFRQLCRACWERWDQPAAHMGGSASMDVLRVECRGGYLGQTGSWQCGLT